jgi:hypothetical protein
MNPGQRYLGLLLGLVTSVAMAAPYQVVTKKEAAKRVTSAIDGAFSFSFSSSVESDYRARAMAGSVAVVDDSYGCNSRLRLTNASMKDQFLVEVTLRFDYSERAKRFHVPYLPALSSTCLDIHSIVPSRTLMVKYEPFAQASVLTRSTAERLLGPADMQFSFYDLEFEPSSSRTLVIQEVLPLLPDEKRFGQLAAHLIPVKGGLRQMADYLANHPDASWLAALSRLLPVGAPGLVPAVEQMLSSSELSAQDMDLLDAVVARQCSGKGPQSMAVAAQLWLGAVKGQFGKDNRQSTVLTHCKAEKTAVQGLLALEDDSFFTAMEAVSPEIFRAVCLAAVGQPGKAARLEEFISKTSDPLKADEALQGQCASLDKKRLAVALASSEESPLPQVKRSRLTRLLERTTEPAERSGIEAELVRAMLDGKVRDEEILRWIRDRQEWAWEQVEPMLAEVARKETDVLKPERLLGTEPHDPAVFDRILANRTALAPCRTEPIDVIRCGSQLEGHFSGRVEQGLQPEFLEKLQDQVMEAVKVPPAEPKSWDAVARFARWGLSTEGITRAMCEKALSMASNGSAGEESFRTALKTVAPEAPCGTQLMLTSLRRTSMDVLILLLESATGVIPLAILFLYVRRKWRAIELKLRAGIPQDKEDRSATGRLRKGWAVAFEKCLHQTRHALASSGTREANRAASIMGQASALEGQLAELTQETALRALQTGELQTCLIRLKGVALYVLAFPGDHDRAQALRRYSTFSEGWVAHANAIREAIRAGDVPPILSLAFFVRPDARSGSMVVGFDDGNARLIPAALVDAKERCGEGDLIHPSRVEFEFARA